MVSASSPTACARLSRPTGPPPNFSITASSSLRSITSRPSTSTSSILSAASATLFETVPSPLTCAKSRTRRSRRLATRGVPRERCAISVAPASSSSTFEQARGALHDLRQVLVRVELQARDDAEAVAQRVGQHAGARGGAGERERRQVELDRARRRALADHDVELEVLQRRIQDLLDHRREAVDLVDEQHVLRLEVGEQRREVAGRSSTGPEVWRRLTPSSLAMMCASVVLPRPGGPNSSTWIERLAAPLGGLDEDLELAAHLLLADVLGERAGAQRALELLLLRRQRPRRDHAVGFYTHRADSARAAESHSEAVFDPDRQHLDLELVGVLPLGARRPVAREQEPRAEPVMQLALVCGPPCWGWG
jgi:hypothetical protein